MVLIIISTALTSIIQGLLMADQKTGAFDEAEAFPEALWRGEGPQH